VNSRARLASAPHPEHIAEKANSLIKLRRDCEFLLLRESARNAARVVNTKQDIDFTPERSLDRPKPFEYLAIGALLLALVSLSLVRIDATDTPWHLATARWAFSEGHWPVCNTFSYTHPDYPLYQQYPLYQSILYAAYLLASWEGLSLLLCVSWIAIFVLWVLWANAGSSRAPMLSLAWMLALLGFQQRMILRPDVMSIFLLIILLLLIDCYRKGCLWVSAAFIAVQWCWANSHQLFPLGLAVQSAFLLHLVAVRTLKGAHGVAQSDSTLPIWPIALAIAGSTLSCLAGPLGTELIRVPLLTARSLYYYGGEVYEFAPFYILPYQVLLVTAATVLAAIGVWKRRRSWQPFEVLLWLIGTVALSAAMRGISLYALVSVGIFCRSFAASEIAGDGSRQGNHHAQRAQLMFRIFCAGVTLLLCGVILHVRWVDPERILGGTQPGIGRALGVWPTESIKFLKENPPPGKMLNLTWYSGNPLIFELFPQHPVFVDPRFESYPKDFLLEAIEAAHKKETLARALLKYQPDWVVTEMQFPHTRKRAAELIKDGNWALVHADSVLLILVRDTPKNGAYISRHRINPPEIKPTDLLWSEPDLLALQRLRLAGLYTELELPAMAHEMLQEVKPEAKRYTAVRRALEEMGVSP
jgi:hypothetical protein